MLHIVLERKVLSEPSETVLCLFGPLKNSGSHNFAHTYQILTKNYTVRNHILRSIFILPNITPPIRKSATLGKRKTSKKCLVHELNVKQVLMWTQTQGIQAISQDTQVQNDPDMNLRYLQPHIHQHLHHQVVKGLEVKAVLGPSEAGDN